MSKVRIEIEIEDRQSNTVIDLEDSTLEAVLKEVRTVAALDDVHVFERDQEDPVGREIEGRNALSLVLHRCHRVLVRVRYEHRIIERKFAPAATVFRVQLWAIGKKGFNLDSMAGSKANLMLPGGEHPLPKESVIGCLVKHHDCSITLDLTLKDFTNG